MVASYAGFSWLIRDGHPTLVLGTLIVSVVVSIFCEQLISKDKIEKRM